MKRESGENPELTRSGIGERKRQELQYQDEDQIVGIKSSGTVYRSIEVTTKWEAVAVGNVHICITAPESEDLPEYSVPIG